MTVQNMWPLIFLFLVPFIIILYILKQRAKDQAFSSVMLWQEIYKNLEAKTPFDKFKNNILMYLQILLMSLLIFALMAPVINKGGFVQEHIVLVIDNSASMQFLYGDNQTRLEYSVALAKRKVDQLNENATVTLISCGSEPTVLYQGQNKATLKLRLNEIENTNEEGTLDAATNLVNSIISGMTNTQIFCYTDTEFNGEQWRKSNQDAALTIESVYSDGANCTLDYVNYSLDKGINVLCKITNYGQEDVVQDVSLYVGSEIVDVQSVTIKAKESETVFFEKQNIPLDANMVLRAELSETDYLAADNKQSIALNADTEKGVLLLSEGNVFLEKALSLEERTKVYKSDNINVLKQAQEESFDLYVFDGIQAQEDLTLEHVGENASLLFWNIDEDFFQQEYIKKKKIVNNCVLSFDDGSMTQYLNRFTFGVTSAYAYTLPEWAQPLVKDAAGNVIGYYGECEGRRIAVLGFDIHNTDLALQSEFPIFMSQLSDWMLGIWDTSVELNNFPVQTESSVNSVNAITLQGDKNNKKTGGRALRNLMLMIVILLLVVEWIVYVFQVNSTKKKQFLAVRIMLLLVVVLSMAGIRIPKKQNKTETIFLVDASDSMNANLGAVEEYLKNTIAQMPKKNKVGVVLFGKNTVIEQFLSDETHFGSFTTEPISVATNIEQAIYAASSMYDENAAKRLVLITDGSENEGSMNLAATSLKGNNVELYSITMQDGISGNHEVYIDGLEAPRVIHVGDHYNVTVSIMSNVETDATISLFAGRISKGQQQVHLTKGQNQFVFEDVGEDGTIARYKATVEPKDDTITSNNAYVTFSTIETSPRLLLVEGTKSEAAEFEKILQANNLEYDLVSPKSVPISLSELNQYKAVITLNVHHDDLRNGFTSVLDSYVKDYAGGYICIGGDNSYALGRYRGTKLEEMLPVSMDLEGVKEIPKMSMTFVIDQSGSMTSPSEENSSVTGLDLAKQAAISGASEVRTTDEVGVLAFDDKYSWHVPIQQATDINAIHDKIASIGYGGGTNIYPALQEAYHQVQNSDAQIKHIVLLTDGQDGNQQYEQLLQQINEANITVSTVAVGKESDQNILTKIANTCGGRFYYTDINNEIPRIFAQEVYLSTKTYLINEEFYPTVTKNHEILTGVLDDGCPPFLGYIASTAKPTADVLLESDREDPILTTWQYGLGRTVAWNSDGNNQWTAAFGSWEQYPLLWSNIIQYVVSDAEAGEDSLEITKQGNKANIAFETKEYDKNTNVKAIISNEMGESEEIVLDQTKPGVFETSVDVDEIGVYNVNIRKSDGTEVVNHYNTAYANQYSLEYQFTDTQMDMATFIKQAGGVEITLEDNIWEAKSEMTKGTMSLTVPLLIVAMLLLLFDIVIRRFSVDLLAYIRKMLHRENAKEKQKTKDDFTKQTKEVVADGMAEQNMNRKIQHKNEMMPSKEQTKTLEPKTMKRKKTKEKDNMKEQNSKLDMDALLKKKQDRNG